MNLALLNDRVVEAIHMNKDDSNHYVCPLCGEGVILRKGKINIPHFSHKKETNCNGCDMTATHRYAEQLLLNSVGKVITLKNITKRIWQIVDDPYSIMGICSEAELLGYRGTLPDLYKEVSVYGCKKVYVENVKLEPHYDKFIPDIELIANTGNRLFIEIKVRHSVDDDKLNKLREYGIPAIEIDLSYIEDLFQQNQIVDLYKEISNVLYTGEIMEHSKWLVEPNYDINECKVIVNNNIKFLIDKYILYRKEFKWEIYGPYNDFTKENDTVKTIEYVNNIFKTNLIYEYRHSSHLKHKRVCFKRDFDWDYNNYSHNKSINSFEFKICGSTSAYDYIVKNGRIINMVTGEITDYSLDNIKEQVHIIEKCCKDDFIKEYCGHKSNVSSIAN